MTHLVQVEMSLILVLVEMTNWRVVQVLRTVEGLEASTCPVSLWLRHADTCRCVNTKSYVYFLSLPFCCAYCLSHLLDLVTVLVWYTRRVQKETELFE
jgi:hypothetical protein